MPSVLFVCTGNQYRSPLAAAAFLRQLELEGKAGEWSVGSAGTWTVPGLSPLPDAIRVAEDLGLSLRDHRTSPVDAGILSRYELVLVMERGHLEAILSEFPSVRGKLHLISEVVDREVYDVPDPAAEDVDLEQTARRVCDLIHRGYGAICRQAGAG